MDDQDLEPQQQQQQQQQQLSAAASPQHEKLRDRERDRVERDRDRDQEPKTPHTLVDTNKVPTDNGNHHQQYCLRWKYHHSNLQTMFSQLLERQAYCDVTLACEGKTLRAHKVVLSACSTYFDTILSQYEEKDPIVIMRDVKFSDIKVLVEFMYKGEINIDHTRLSSLLKTAEDLHIKGLAEVSWRSDGQHHQQQHHHHHRDQQSQQQQQQQQQQLPQQHHEPTSGSSHEHSPVEALLRDDSDLSMGVTPPKQRRRGRPPLDDAPSAVLDVFTPKITCITGSQSDDDSSQHMIIDHHQDHHQSSWDDDDMSGIVMAESNYKDDLKQHSQQQQNSSGIQMTAVPEQFRNVIKMNDYLTTGRRQEFWEEPFTRRVMDAIKSKELEMKMAAEILGVSYGTLYGRYRDSYGCLKHPYRVRDFWTEPGPAEVLLKLRRKEITLFRAAECLNVTVHTLATYLSTLQGSERISLQTDMPNIEPELLLQSHNSNDDILRKLNATLQQHAASSSDSATTTTLSHGTTSIKREGGGYFELPIINPDITIVKAESIRKPVPQSTPTTPSENNNAKLMSGGAVVTELRHSSNSSPKDKP